MHDPIKALLNVPDQEVADRLTEKWTDAKLGELQYVGVTVGKTAALKRKDNGLVTSTVAAAFSWASIPTDPWSVDACWMSSLVLALTAISLAAQQTIGLNRLRSCENGLLKIRHLLGEAPWKQEHHSDVSHVSDDAKDGFNRTKIKRSQLWAWQTPIMMSNFAILLFIVGLMIAIFARAAATMGDWSKPDGKIAVFFGGATVFAGVNYLICWISLNRGSLVSSTQLKAPG
ncbi:MAG: hypothetical protein OHK93_001667 [Ramalina farinacea]|uniref:Uncharacterized protein n=1 Tax=Ramalina farinacea TaxID=258253 RepID=A0AA43QRN8_9LECA|nr:hypothetical protein [Ramalina farinacea]